MIQAVRLLKNRDELRCSGSEISYRSPLLTLPPRQRIRVHAHAAGGGEAESFISVAAGDTGPIYLNDRFMGYVDELNNVGGGLLVSPGTYDLLVDSQKFGQIHQKVTVEANKVTVIRLEQPGDHTASADRSSR